ncbi:MAG: amidohydrolase family protein [Clostridia bacterium]|nr:amidohydrolase family protein [Clostridia bacterium]
MVIDFHTHIFPDKIAKRTIEALSMGASIPAHSTGDFDGLVRSMTENGIDISVNLPVLTRASQLESVTAFAKEINEKSYTGARIISFAGIHPDIEDYEKALYDIKEKGFLGIKLHPDYQGTYIDDEKYIRILKCAKELDLITLTHSGFDGAYVGQPIKCTPKRVARVLDRLGGYEGLVLAHMGANELFHEFTDTLAGENVYIDTSYVLPFIGKDMFCRMVEKHGANKILFASDSPWQDQGEMVRILKSYISDKELEDMMLYKNAKKLLKI